MKKLIYILLMLLSVYTLKAQVSRYTFSFSIGSYTEILNGTVIAASTGPAWLGGGLVNEVYPGISLPFPFYIDGNFVSSINITTSGFITTGATLPSIFNSSPISSSESYTSAISPFGYPLEGLFYTRADLDSGSNVLTNLYPGGFWGLVVGKRIFDASGIDRIVPGTTITEFNPGAGTITMSAPAVGNGMESLIIIASGEIRTQTQGSAPNRVFVIEYRNFCKEFLAGTFDNYNFQIRLKETSHVIEFMYAFPVTNNVVRNFQVGLRGTSNTDFNNRTGTTWQMSIPGITNTATLPVPPLPDAATTYTFTPNTSPPFNLTATPVSSSQINLNWVDLSNETYFRIERSTNGSSWTLIDSVSANVTSYQNMGLSPNTDYYYRVYGRVGSINSGYSNIAVGRTFLLSPEHFLPQNTATNLSVTPNFFWQFIAGVDFYHLQIASDINFNALVLNDSTLTSGFYTPPYGILENGNTYYWRVRAKNAVSISVFSSPWSFSTSGANGAALDFDGVNDNVTVPNISGINNFSSTLKFTIEFWCKVNSNTGNFTFINKGGGGGLEQYSIDIFGSNLRYYVKADGGAFTFIDVPRITVGEGWVHIAATFDHSNGIMKLYKNGIQIGSATPPSSLNNNTNPFAIGVQANSINQPLKGKMDEVRIWNIARTQSEIQSNMLCEIPTTISGLVANYHFNQGSAASTNTGINSLTDVSGNNNNGTLNDFALTGITSNWIAPSGVVSGNSCGNAAALDFDGVNDNVSVPDISGINNFSNTLKFSIEFWCKVNSDNENFTFVNKGGGGGLEQYSIDIVGFNLRYYVKSSGGSFTTISVPRITVAEEWVHIAATFDYSNGIMKLYKNGVEIGSTSPPSSLNSNTNPLALGVQANSINQPLNGRMDEVRIWNRARTQSEIQNKMNCEIQTVTFGLGINYHFNQGAASGVNTGVTTLADASGYNRHGTLNGFALTGKTSNWIAPGGVTTGSSCLPDASTINIKVIPEGFYNGSEKLNMKDTVRAYLHSSVSPYNVIDSAVANRFCNF